MANIRRIYKRKLLLLVHRAEHDQNAPVSIKDMFTRRKNTYSLRSALALEIPRPKTEFDRGSIKYRATIIWNSLPNEYKILKDSNNFKKCIKALGTLNDFPLDLQRGY